MSNINRLNWQSSILELAKTKKIPKNLQALFDSGVRTILDLIWIAPLKVQSHPIIKSFDHLEFDELFLGEATIINIKMSPAYSKYSKSKVKLFNIQAIIKDKLSENYLTLKWFNSYPTTVAQLKELEETNSTFSFLASISDFKGIIQGINPKINPKVSDEINIVQYPKINGVSSKFVKDYINRIPKNMFKIDIYPQYKELLSTLNIDTLSEDFKVLHGLYPFDKHSYQKSRDNIIYLEFFLDHLQVMARKRKNSTLITDPIKVSKDKIKEFISKFEYKLTLDQSKSIESILKDLESNKPMMRIIQGDVGCGKTTVAIISAFAALSSNHQVAIMCPTESLANQLYSDFSSYLSFESCLLTGSVRKSDQLNIKAKIKSGQIKLIIGTHSLFQESVDFKDLRLIVIDEQHKFGVEQRQKLALKGNKPHSLIMSATPIPRTLQLAKYGDLDISSIKTMPKGKKEIKTRIVEHDNFEKFLSFVKTRLGLQEQIYIVTAAIEESELDIKNLNLIFDNFSSFFPEASICKAHGKQTSEEKALSLKKFKDQDIDILVATSVIEVGINNPNATVIAIFNPERFGLSSLHQLRGRVARGDKNGFCFLIADQKMSQDSLDRLKVMEETNDGFKIAQADLISRGQGNLFGKEQSGKSSYTKIANIFLDNDIFEQVVTDLESILLNKPHLIDNIVLDLTHKNNISSTI